jgi:cation diffusion facilitator CzcD-associated flavoprotein CzcO
VVLQKLRRRLPNGTATRIARGKNWITQMVLYQLAQRAPRTMRKLLMNGVRRQLPPGYPVDTHFRPAYDPWDQRLCVVPDGDLFAAMRQGRAEVVTDTIETFTRTGVRTVGGRDLEADIVVTATGLQVQLIGGAQVGVDGEPVAFNRLMTYKGVLVEDLPNFAFIFGYTNASWTLKADLGAEYVTRLLQHMDEHGHTTVTPRSDDDVRGTDSVLASLNSGYVRRGDAVLPRQGTTAPWRVLNNYLRDTATLRRSPIDDAALEFGRDREQLAGEPAAAPAQVSGTSRRS